MLNRSDQFLSIQPFIDYEEGFYDVYFGRSRTMSCILPARNIKFMKATIIAAGFYFIKYDYLFEPEPKLFKAVRYLFKTVAYTSGFMLPLLYTCRVTPWTVDFFGSQVGIVPFLMGSLIALLLVTSYIEFSVENALNNYKLQCLYNIATSVSEQGDVFIQNFEAARHGIYNFKFNDDFSVGLEHEDFKDPTKMPNIGGFVLVSMRKAGILNPITPTFLNFPLGVFLPNNGTDRNYDRIRGAHDQTLIQAENERSTRHFIMDAEDSLRLIGAMKLMPVEMSRLTAENRVPVINYANNEYGRAAREWHLRLRNLISTIRGIQIADDIPADLRPVVTMPVPTRVNVARVEMPPVWGFPFPADISATSSLER